MVLLMSRVKGQGQICDTRLLPSPQTLFNPNKTVVKMFLVTYNFSDMPVNHMTFLRHRIFLLPVEEGAKGKGKAPPGGGDRKKILCYLIHLR